MRKLDLSKSDDVTVPYIATFHMQKEDAAAAVDNDFNRLQRMRLTVSFDSLVFIPPYCQHWTQQHFHHVQRCQQSPPIIHKPSSLFK